MVALLGEFLVQSCDFFFLRYSGVQCVNDACIQLLMLANKGLKSVVVYSLIVLSLELWWRKRINPFS